MVTFSAKSLLVCLSWAPLSSALTPCYYQNGTNVAKYHPNNLAYQPCNTTAEASMCCRINLDPGTPGDHCRPDGLCDSPEYEFLWRESCTDPTWKSPYCQKLCLNYRGLDAFGGSAAGVDVALTACDDGSICCGVGQNGTSCCAAGKGVWMVDGKETHTNPNLTVSASAAIASDTSKPSQAAQSASSTSTSSSASATSSPSSKSNTGAIAGGVVGGIGGLALVAGGLLWIFRRRQSQGDDTAPPAYRYPTELDNSAEKRYRSEMPAAVRPQEMDGLPRTELEAGVVHRAPQP